MYHKVATEETRSGRHYHLKNISYLVMEKSPRKDHWLTKVGMDEDRNAEQVLKDHNNE